MVFVGELGQSKQLAPQDNGVFRMFHKYHLEMIVLWNSLCAIIMKQNNRRGESPGGSYFHILRFVVLEFIVFIVFGGHDLAHADAALQLHFLHLVVQ